MGRERVFDDVTLEWDGDEYTIPADKMWGALKQVKQVLPFHKLMALTSNPREADPFDLAEAYSVALKCAGADVSPELVYSRFFSGADQSSIQVGLQQLLTMMIPPEHLRDKLPSATSANSKKKKPASSRRRTS